MTTIKKILCAIDLGKGSRNAFDRALTIARVSGARLYILDAVPKKFPFSSHAAERLELPTSLRQSAEREGVPVQVVEQHGDRLVSSCCMPTRGKPTSSSSDRTVDAVGSGSGRAPWENVCFAVQRGRC